MNTLVTSPDSSVYIVNVKTLLGCNGEPPGAHSNVGGVVVESTAPSAGVVRRGDILYSERILPRAACSDALNSG